MPSESSGTYQSSEEYNAAKAARPKSSAEQIASLQQDLADVRADYLRRNNDALDWALRAKAAEQELVAAREACGTRAGFFETVPECIDYLVATLAATKQELAEARAEREYLGGLHRAEWEAQCARAETAEAKLNGIKAASEQWMKDTGQAYCYVGIRDYAAVRERLEAADDRERHLLAALTMPDADRRLWFISDCLGKRGHFNRSDICKAFGVSVQQASIDIRRWMERHPDAINYNKSLKRYEHTFRALASKEGGE